jgi:hypothetical protein
VSAAASMPILTLARPMRELINQSSYNRSEPFHVSPPQVNKYPRETMHNHSVVRHFDAENRHSDARWRDIIPAAYGDLKSSVKRLQRDAECSERAARNLLSGETLPSTRVLIRLMQTNAQVFDAVCHAIGRIPEKITPTPAQFEQLQADIADLRKRLEGKGL